MVVCLCVSDAFASVAHMYCIMNCHYEHVALNDKVFKALSSRQHLCASFQLMVTPSGNWEIGKFHLSCG